MNESTGSSRHSTSRLVLHTFVFTLVVGCMFAIAFVLPENHRVVRSYTDTWFGVEPADEILEVAPTYTVVELTTTLNQEESEFSSTVQPPVKSEETARVDVTEFVTTTQLVTPPSLDTFSSVKLELVTALVNVEHGADSKHALQAIERAKDLAESQSHLASVIPLLETSTALLLENTGIDKSYHLARLDEISREVMRTSFTFPNEVELTSVRTSDIGTSSVSEASNLWDELADGLSSVYKVSKTDTSDRSPGVDPTSEVVFQFKVLILLERARGFLLNQEYDSYTGVLEEASELLQAVIGRDSQVPSIATQLQSLNQIKVKHPREALLSALNALNELEQSELIAKESTP